MPLNPAPLSFGFLAPNLATTGHFGYAVPKFSTAIAIGVCQYLTAQAKVVTADVGTLGAGTSLFPLLVPSPLLLSSLTSALVASGQFGAMAPKMVAGLTNGLTSGLAALALLFTNHPTVGVGTGVARIVGLSAVPAMLLGFSAVGMVGSGPTKMARAIGNGLDMTFATFVQVGIPIVGAGTPIAGAGAGFGTVV